MDMGYRVISRPRPQGLTQEVIEARSGVVDAGNTMWAVAFPPWRLEAGRWICRDFEIVFAFELTGLNQNPVDDAGSQRVGWRARHGGSHAANGLAIEKAFDRNRVGVRNEMPERWRVGVGLKCCQREDFD